MTDMEERLREHGIIAGWLIEKDAEIARLRKGIQDYLDGNYEHPRAHRLDLGNCKHDIPWYAECVCCDCDHFTALLTPAQRPDVEKTGEGQS